MKESKIVINADDFGITVGTNRAILEGHDKGVINSTSCMTNADFFSPYIEELKKRPTLDKGVHLNLTYGKSLSAAASLTDSRTGLFKNGYFSLMLKGFSSKKFRGDVEKEWRRQLEMLSLSGITITHIDSHRHVHMIPPLFKIASALSSEYGVPRVRSINESLWRSILIFRSLRLLFNGGVVKFFLLRLFAIANKRSNDSYKEWEFFSILYTGTIDGFFLKKIFEGGTYGEKNIEIMIHPSLTELDSAVVFYDKNEEMYRLSADRDIEYRAILDVTLKQKNI